MSDPRPPHQTAPPPAPEPSTKTSAPEGPLPSTWTEAIPYVVWVVLILGFGLELVNALTHAEWWRALACFAGLVLMMAGAIHWRQVRGRIERTSPNLLFVALALLLAAIIFSPFVEQQRWPFSAWFDQGMEAQKSTLTEWLRQAQGERDQAQRPGSSNAQTQRERDQANQTIEAQRQDIDRLVAKINELEKARTTDTSRLTELQAQLNTAQQQLQQTTAKLAAAAMPIDPNNPPPKDPYRPGQIFSHKYTRDEAIVLIGAIRELQAIATDITVPNFQITVGARRTILDDIRIGETPKLIEAAEAAKSNLESVNGKIKGTISKYATYSIDLQNVVGDTGIERVISEIQQYIGVLNRLKESKTDLSKLEPWFVAAVLQDGLRRLRLETNNFQHWRQTFMDKRVSEARQILESYL